MKTRQEIKEWIIANCVNEEGDIDLSSLDFSDFDGNVKTSRMKVKKSLLQGHQEVGESLIQLEQRVGDDLFQSRQIVGGYLFQTRQTVGGNLIRKVGRSVRLDEDK